MILFLFLILGAENILIGMLAYLLFNDFYTIKTRYVLKQNRKCIYLIKEDYKKDKIINKKTILRMQDNQIEVL